MRYNTCKSLTIISVAFIIKIIHLPVYSQQLRLDQWGPEARWTEAMRRSIPLSQMRVLLRGPSCRVWFLGERIHSWRLGVRVRRPPLAPPRHMLWAHLLEGQELERALRGQDADGLRERRRSQYSDFICTRLLQRIPLGTTGRVSI